MLDLKKKLIVALDVPTLEMAEEFVDKLCGQVKFFKVGSQLFTASGPETIRMIGAKNAKVFLDLKFHDIPKTVYSAIASGTSSSVKIHSIPTGFEGKHIEDQVKEAVQFPVFMMTVHTRGGEKMLKEAVKGAEEKALELKIPKPFIVGVTRLTSDEYTQDIEKEVLEAAVSAKRSGLDGVVCSALEAPIIRKEFGKNFLIVTPGIRPKGYKKDDQSRITTAQEAIDAGADFIVIGRPILEAKDPVFALEKILKD
jgi:orotidine-5'-phosphate decarboxylase